MNHFVACGLLLCLCWPGTAWSQATLSDQYRQKAEACYARADYDKAETWYEKAYALVRRSDPVRAANLCVDLSSLDYAKNHTRTGIDRCLLGVRHIGSRKTAPDSVRFKLFSSLGTFYVVLFQKDSALYYFRKADALLTHNPQIEAEIPLYVLYHFNNQGNWYLKTANHTRSLAFLTKARQMAQKYSTPGEMAYIESNLAGCYNAMGQFSEALMHMRRAAQLPADDTQRWRHTLGMGWTLHNLKRHTEALAYFAKAERHLTGRRQQPTNYLLDQINLWRIMGSCYRAANQLAKADDYINRAVRLHRNQLGRQGALLAQVLLEKGRNQEHRREIEPAVNTYQAAIRAVCRDTANLTSFWQNPAVETASDEATLLLAVVHKAAALKKHYDATRKHTYLNAAATTYQYGVGLQQHIRHGIDTDQSQVFFSARQHTLVPDAIAVTFEAYQQQRSPARRASLRETLFQLFEQAQAGSLRETFQQNSIKPQTIPGPLLEREQRLKKQMGELKKRLVTDTAATAELTAVQVQWHQLIDTFRQDYPAYYRLNYQNAVISSQTLQQHLGDRAAYLAYVRRGASLFVLVATNQELAVLRQPIDSARFDGQLHRLSQELYQDPVLGRYKGTAYAAALYAACMEPVQAYLTGRTRLIISRDWSFHFLPFEVLETGRQARDYLTRHVAIAYAFSAQTFFDRRRRSVSTRPVLMVAPFARTEMATPTARRQEAAQTLASSEKEARSIGGDLLIGHQASISNFLRANLDRPVIYLATHARTDNADPANSYIAFHPGESDKLYTDDIQNLPLASTGLVVLGACETGSGRTMRGEGILSLARDFSYAGCPSVITTLWTANDQTTSFLTIRLHHHLAHGMAIDQALQQARADFFDSDLAAKYDHPYYWANYTLLGNHDAVMAGSVAPTIGWGVGVVAVCLVGAGLFWYRKRRMV